MKKDKNKTAKILALAFFESEKDTAIRKQHFSELKKVNTLIEQSPDLSSFLANPRFSKEEREIFFSLIKPSKNILLFLKLIMQNHLIYQLKTITHHYENLLYGSRGVVKAKVIVSHKDDVSRPIKELMEEKLKDLLNKEIHLDFEIDPSLMGGFTLEANGFYLDASLKKTLADLQNSL